jgi:prophage regulatory protein
MTYLSVKQVAARYGVHPCTIWRWSKAGDFPSPIQFGPQTQRWNELALNEHDAKQQDQH